jgi:hypothetical protein
MTLKETLAQLEALGNEKVRAQNSKNGAGDNQFGVNTAISENWPRRSRPSTLWPLLSGKPGTLMPCTRRMKSDVRRMESRPRRCRDSDASIQGNTLMGRCEGAQSPFYKVRAELDGGGIRSASCNCNQNSRGYCKHIVALLLTYAHKPELFAVHKDPAELLAEFDREQLAALLAKLMGEQPELYETVEAAMDQSKTGPSAANKRKKPTAKRKKVDVEPYRRRVRGIMQSLDRMRRQKHTGMSAD